MPDPGNPPDRKRCTKCGRLKNRDAFGPDRRAKSGLTSWCRSCDRTRNGARRQTGAYRQWVAIYSSRPEVRERRQQSERKRQIAKETKHREYRQSLWGRLIRGRISARYRLRKTTDERALEKIRITIARYDTEIARLRESGMAPSNRREQS